MYQYNMHCFYALHVLHSFINGTDISQISSIVKIYDHIQDCFWEFLQDIKVIGNS